MALDAGQQTRQVFQGGVYEQVLGHLERQTLFGHAVFGQVVLVEQFAQCLATGYGLV